MMDEDYDKDDYEMKQEYGNDLEYIQDKLVELLNTTEEILKVVEDIYEHQRKK